MDIWYDDNFITKNEIIKSFKDTGISGEVDNFVEKYDEEFSDGIMDLKDQYINGGDSIIENYLGNDDNKIYIY